MNFNELKRACETNHIPTVKVAEEIGLTYEGLKRGVMNGSLGIRYVIPLCEILCISPNKFLGYHEAKSGTQNQNGCLFPVQQMDTSSLKILQDQLKEKDEQIKQLLNILAK